MPVMLIRVIRYCNVRSDFYDVNRVLFKDGRVLSRFLISHLQSCVWVLYYIYGHHRGCLDNSIFLNLGLCAACWARFMCHHELWPTPVSHPFSPNSYLGFAGGNTTRKLLTISLDLFFKILLVAFLIFFAITICYPYFLLVGLLLHSVPLFHSRELVKYLE